MVVSDLYKVLAYGQEVIIKDCNQKLDVAYKGKIEYIPLDIIDNNIRWIGSSDIYVATIEVMIY